MQSNDTRPPEEPDDIGPIRLGDYVVLLWRFKWLPILCAVAAGALMFVSSTSGSRVYESIVTFAATQSKIGDTSPATTASPASFRPIIESRTTALAVIKELGLDKDPYRLTPTALFEEVASVDEVRGTNLMRVIVRFPDAALAARIANSVARHAVEVARKVSSDEAVQAKDMIGEQLTAARTRLDEAARQLKAYREEAQIEALKQDVEAALAKRGEVLDLLVTIEAEKAKLARMEADLAKHNRVDVMKKTIDSEPALAEAARAQAPGNAAALGLQLRSEVIDEVYRQLDQAAAETRAKLASLQKQKAELVDVRKINAAKMPLLMRLYEREATLSRREDEHFLARKIYEDISQRYEAARLQVAGRSAQLVILDEAIPADRPVSREVARKTAVAALVGFCIAIVGLLLWHAAMQQWRRAPAR
jgi:uncharacterized protein involved in exopolysaccharide biosynthesis